MKKLLISLFVIFFSFIVITPFKAVDTTYDTEEEALKQEIELLKQRVKEPGIYEITLRYKSSTGTVVEKTIQINITAGSITIQANDVHLALSEVSKMTQEMWIEKAEIVVQTSMSKTIPINIDSSAVLSQLGTYNLIISSGGTTKTVKVFVESDAYVLNKGIKFDQSNHEVPSQWNSFSFFSKETIQFIILVFLLLPFIIIIIFYFLITGLIKKVNQSLT